MLIDIKIDAHYNAQMVAGELVNLGLQAATCYWTAGIVRGRIDEAELATIQQHRGVLNVHESDGAKINSSVAPVIPSSYGLGLCDPNVLFTPEQLKQRNRDLAAIAQTRRIPPPNDIYI